MHRANNISAYRWVMAEIGMHTQSPSSLIPRRPGSSLILPRPVWVVGDDRAELYPTSLFRDGLQQPLWSWHAASDPSMPSLLASAFTVLDECKPVQHGERALVVVTASSGGVAVIDRDTRQTIFARRLFNAHSADILADGSVVAAASTGGDALVRWRMDAQEPLFQVPLPHAHAVVPDAARGLLWSGGGRQVVAFDYGLTSPEPRVVIVMPDDEVHDLCWDCHQNQLLCSTQNAVWTIDPDTRVVQPWQPLAQMRLVKGIAPPHDDGAICFHKGEGGTWSSDVLYALTPAPQLAMVRFPGRKLYKARWDRRTELP
jgi:hypothetical protein